MTNYFEALAAVDCSAHVEKKGRFSYLSWPFAFAELFKRFPKTEIEVHEWDGLPMIAAPKGYLVKVSVTIEGVRRTQWHPVLDNNNRPIAEPDVFQINTSIQRATVKAIALHGLGLYIYAGEDLPAGAQEDTDQPSPVADALFDKIDLSETEDELRKVKDDIKAATLPDKITKTVIGAYNAKLRKLKGGDK